MLAENSLNNHFFPVGEGTYHSKGFFGFFGVPLVKIPKTGGSGASRGIETDFAARKRKQFRRRIF